MSLALRIYDGDSLHDRAASKKRYSDTTIQGTGTGTVHKLCKLLHMNVLKHHMRHEGQYFPGGWLFKYLKFYLKKAQNNRQILCNIYNMSGHVVSDIQTRAEGESLYI